MVVGSLFLVGLIDPCLKGGVMTMVLPGIQPELNQHGIDQTKKQQRAIASFPFALSQVASGEPDFLSACAGIPPDSVDDREMVPQGLHQTVENIDQSIEQHRHDHPSRPSNMLIRGQFSNTSPSILRMNMHDEKRVKLAALLCTLRPGHTGPWG